MKPDKSHAAVCGLFCPACTLFIGTNEDPARLASLAKRMGRPVEDLRCRGCRSDTRSFFCRTKCTMAACAAGRGIDFCGECGDYPCADLKTFQAQMPHRLELWNSLSRIREAGYEAWCREMEQLYSCPACKTLNSAYDLACRKCGHEPGSEYVRLHREQLEPFADRMK